MPRGRQDRRRRQGVDSSFRYANLHRTDTGKPLQTSIKVHIDIVRRSGRRDLSRLLKVWKVRRRVVVKSCVLEPMAIEGARGTSLTELEPQLLAALVHIRDRIQSGGAVHDPANSNNELANSMSVGERAQTAAAARAAIEARTWREVFE